MRIALVTGSYPYAADRSAGRFVQQFAFALSREGIEVTVVAPIPYARRRRGRLPPLEAYDGDERGVAGGGPRPTARIRVLRPRYHSFSSRDCWFLHTGRITQVQFNRSVLAAVRSLDSAPDLLYGHFLYEAGYAAVKAANLLGRPSVVAVGEGTFWTVRPFGLRRAREHFKTATGMLAVSSLLSRMLIDQLAVTPDKIRVFSNGIDTRRFYPRDRDAMCRKFGVPSRTFNIVFVGSFDEIKGVQRLLEATEGLDAARLVLVGRGSLRPSSPLIAFKRELDHGEVAEILSVADAFVLPSTEEGSCNALVEALASGLPIITSNGAYNDDIVDDEVAVRVDPMDVRGIREAIFALMNDPARRKSMSQACLEKSKQFDINLRARRVAAWLEEILHDFRAKRTEVAPIPANAPRRESFSDQPKEMHGSRSVEGTK